jgi:hypothetical protein
MTSLSFSIQIDTLFSNTSQENLHETGRETDIFNTSATTFKHKSHKEANKKRLRAAGAKLA